MRKGELTKQAILEQATRIASRVGLGGLTIGMLAEQAELSKSGLFAHFKSKEALQQEVLTYASGRFIDLVMRPALGAPRGEPRLRELFERLVGWCKGDALPGGCLFFAAAAELDDQPGPVRDQLVRDQTDLIDSIMQMFRGGIKEGHFRADADAEQFAHDLHSAMLGFSYSYRLMKDPAAEARTRRMFEFLLAAAGKTPH
jgi:AcrR family transcriptional regulator